jgi:gamma-glutamyltranspeptidase/glutathione hydrolase
MKTVGALLAILAIGGTALPVGAQTPLGASPDFAAFRGDRANGWAGQTRSETVAANGMVATSQPMAAQAGLDILKAGGNAFDAAVAAAAVLNLVEPGSAGMGGDAFILAWSAKDKKLIALDGSGRAASGATPQRYAAKGLKAVPSNGIESAVTPGAVDAWDVMLKTYGSRDFKTVLEPAARLAEQGFGVTERIGRDWAADRRILTLDPDTTRVYMPGGAPPALYSRFRNPDLAKAFRLLQSQGRDAFYKGAIGQAIVAKSQALGGSITMADLASVHAKWVQPLTTQYRGYDLYEMPPSTQGFGVLEMMNIVEQCGPKIGVDVKQTGPKSAAYWHLMVEAKKLAYADLERYDGDPEFGPVDTDRLTSKAYAASLCARIDPKHASTPAKGDEPIGGTVYIATADRFGNVVSMIYSVYGEFGSGVTIPGYGFIMNNRAAQFTLDTKSPNVIAPGKRPFYTIIPGFVMKGGKPFMAYGLMSGDQQAQGHGQVLSYLLDFGANPQAATDAARFSHSQRTNQLVLETDLFNAVGAELKAMGHDVHTGNGARMGGYQAIMIDPNSGLYRGGSDHRKDGMAVGY